MAKGKELKQVVDPGLEKAREKVKGMKDFDALLAFALRRRDDAVQALKDIGAAWVRVLNEFGLEQHKQFRAAFWGDHRFLRQLELVGLGELDPRLVDSGIHPYVESYPIETQRALIERGIEVYCENRKDGEPDHALIDFETFSARPLALQRRVLGKTGVLPLAKQRALAVLAGRGKKAKQDGATWKVLPGGKVQIHVGKQVAIVTKADVVEMLKQM